jgi:glutamate dehydrogenase (NAD(P)+)
MVVEGANGPTTYEGDLILRERGIPVLPDILANAGGVVCSYFEWVQDLQTYFWDLAEVRAQLQKMICRAFHEVWLYSAHKGLDLRLAAYAIAVERVAHAIEQRGLFP